LLSKTTELGIPLNEDELARLRAARADVAELRFPRSTTVIY